MGKGKEDVEASERERDKTAKAFIAY